jgi:hypothetical protein
MPREVHRIVQDSDDLDDARFISAIDQNMSRAYRSSRDRQNAKSSGQIVMGAAVELIGAACQSDNRGSYRCCIPVCLAFAEPLGRPCNYIGNIALCRVRQSNLPRPPLHVSFVGLSPHAP